MKYKWFTATFLSLCLIPAAGMLVLPEQQAAGNEHLTPKPSLWNAQTGWNADFLGGLTDYVADHFGFRQELVTANAALQDVYKRQGLGGLNGFNLTGDGLVLLSAVSAGAGALVSRIYTPGRDPMLLTGWQLLIGGCFLLGVGTMGGGALGRVTLGGVLLLGYMIVLLSLIHI